MSIMIYLSFCLFVIIMLLKKHEGMSSDNEKREDEGRFSKNAIRKLQ